MELGKYMKTTLRNSKLNRDHSYMPANLNKYC